MAAPGLRRPNPSLFKPASHFPSCFDDWPGSGSQRNVAASTLCLAVGRKHRAVATTCPANVLPSHSEALFGTHPTINQNRSNLIQQRRSLGQVACLFLSRENPLPMGLTWQHRNIRHGNQHSPFSGLVAARYEEL